MEQLCEANPRVLSGHRVDFAYGSKCCSGCLTKIYLQEISISTACAIHKEVYMHDAYACMDDMCVRIVCGVLPTLSVCICF
jgi:hypothetical protein